MRNSGERARVAVRSIIFRKTMDVLPKTMDARVKPAHDEYGVELTHSYTCSHFVAHDADKGMNDGA
jgi:hypothetical protein